MEFLAQTVASAETVANIRKLELNKTLTNKEANNICYGK